jgi:hypothetical protein
LIPIVVVIAARVLLSLATNGIVLGISLVFFIIQGGDGARAATTEVFKGVTVVETIFEEVDDLIVGDVDYGCVLVEEMLNVLA